MASEFDCDLCGDGGMCEYRVTFTDLSKCELCGDCLELMRNDERVGILTASRFVGLAP